MNIIARRSSTCLASLRSSALVLLGCLLLFDGVAAQEETHTHEHGHDRGVHFTHPLFAESVSPDTKLRLDYSFTDLEAGKDGSEMELEGEYAFAPSFSLEIGMHLEPDAGELGETHVLFKFANYAFGEAGLLLGYGVELGLPTGSGHAHEGGDHTEPDHEHDHAEPEDDIYTVAPFLNAGWTSGAWEVVGWGLFEIPTNQALQENVGTGFRYDASVLYRVNGRLEALVEAFGETGLSGPGTDRTVLNVAPALRVRPLADRPLVLGAGVAVPVTDAREYEARVLVSLFYHF